MKTYSVKEAAEYCKCHPETIREYIRSGMIIASKPGRGYCIRQTALDVFLNELENKQVQASLESRSERKCQSINETTVTIISTSQQRAVEELDDLLEPKTGKKPKGCMIN